MYGDFKERNMQSGMGGGMGSALSANQVAGLGFSKSPPQKPRERNRSVQEVFRPPTG